MTFSPIEPLLIARSEGKYHYKLVQYITKQTTQRKHMITALKIEIFGFTKGTRGQFSENSEGKNHNNSNLFLQITESCILCTYRSKWPDFWKKNL